LGSISALIIWIAVTADTFGKYTVLKNKVLTLIGDASYSIYLIHPIFLSMLCRVLAAAIRSKHLPLFVEGIFLVGVFILTVIGGIVVHIVVEKRLIKIASDKFLPAKTRKPVFMNDEN
jgi:exopolysaccharide production protein ExoZ